MTRPARMAPWLPGFVTALVGVTLPLAAGCGVLPVGNCGGGGMLSRGSDGWFLVIFLTSEQPLSPTQRAARRAHDPARTTNCFAASLNTESSGEWDKSRWNENQGSGV